MLREFKSGFVGTGMLDAGARAVRVRVDDPGRRYGQEFDGQGREAYGGYTVA